ncbi:MAG: Na+/H+ antiporter NhaA [Alphaproteobacteria bacterium]
MQTKDNPYLNNPFKKSVSKFAGAANVFLRMEASGGIILALAAVLALIVANTPLYGFYDHVLHAIKFRIGFDDIGGSFDYEIKKSILHWVNDGFMAIFFFLVGLEIKREIKSGELSTRSRALLPAIAAVGGMIIPALIYYFINKDIPENINGWAIPAATDIAFALGVLSLLGTRAPVRLKILLMAIAIIDDLGAILIIAFFYTSNLQLEPLYFGAFALVGLALLNAKCVTKTAPYVLLGIILWIAVLKSGVHATLAGVVTAFFIPVVCKNDPKITPCKTLEHALHPWVAFFILPIFAFANAGVPFDGMGLHSLKDPTTLGIILGLVVGKQVGVFSFLWLCIKTGLSPMPNGVSWMHLYGVSALCGIGFTMSLFIGGLAFDDMHHQAAIRLGVLVASVLSAVMGYYILRYAAVIEKHKAKAAH